MTTTASHQSGAGSAPAVTVGSALRDLLEATLHYVNGRLSQKTSGWADELDDYEETRGSVEQAGYEGVKATIQGHNPVWAAAKGAWAGASTELKVAVVLFIVLMLILAPVPTLLVGLALLIAAIVKSLQSGDR
jgi:hypothetical protein